MASMLEGALKKKIAKGFKGKLCKGSLRREGTSALDNRGNPVAVSATTYSIEGIRQEFKADYRDRMSIPVTDISILIILGLGTLNTNGITPKEDDKIFIGVPFNKWYKCRRVLEIDPAGASCMLQAYEIPAP